jgi:hypothetical protein
MVCKKCEKVDTNYWPKKKGDDDQNERSDESGLMFILVFASY